MKKVELAVIDVVLHALKGAGYHKGNIPTASDRTV